MKDLNQRLEEIRTALSPSFDIVYRHVTIQNTQAWLIFLSSLSDSELIASLVEGFVITAGNDPVPYTPLRAHETPEHLVCRLLPEKKKASLIPSSA